MATLHAVTDAQEFATKYAGWHVANAFGPTGVVAGYAGSGVVVALPGVFPAVAPPLNTVWTAAGTDLVCRYAVYAPGDLLLEAPSAGWLPLTSLQDPARYPHKCPHCGAPAYIGAGYAPPDCSARCT